MWINTTYPEWIYDQMDIVKYIRKCITWRDLYSLKESFLQHGLCIANTVNGNRVICVIKNGKMTADRLFDDYIFAEGRDNDYIPDKIIEMISEFVVENSSNESLLPNIKNYHINANFYGKPLIIVNEHKMLSEQQIKYISDFIQD